ncbi:MAG TPA: hypothetical protein PLE16_03215 [Spirochaetota bacterium]|nr:hypothetical protein [Spirochaetota bacterium]HPM33592.1 hypothetical protein [Spirochaetota bacterium]HPY02639.1 hypothetical protein [Spirochaetota bacterium]HQA52521.1 hypothetical protein [Spirochaetota bacterium]
MSNYKLIQEILIKSQSKIWDYAKTEWTLVDIFEADEQETCLCGHYPIKELCELHNSINGQTVIVGNQCVKKFMGISSDKLFESVKKVKSDIEKAINLETISFLFKKGLISKWENDFYTNTYRKRIMSDEQIRKRIEINKKVLQLVKKRGIK